MIQNIKVDIVYYMTATDFEFEFNLGSCCHMRLLNDKVKDKKAYVSSLARAVSRSTIILSVGPVFGEEGLISITATAIGKGLKTIDNKTFGIADDGKIEIIDGSIPLVTPEGYFGGCIIESGPQTIVLLTENRTIRKTIMKTLVHPYIEDMCLMQSAGKASFVRANIAVPPVKEEEISEPEHSEEIQTEEIPQPEEADNIELIKDDEQTAEEEPQAVNEEETQEPEPEPQDNAQAERDIEFDFSIDNDSSANPDEKPEDNYGLLVTDDESGKKKGSKGINISIIIITALLLLTIIGLCYMLIFLPMRDGVTTAQYIKQLFDSASSTVSV